MIYDRPDKYHRHMFVIPAVRRWRQEKLELEASLGYIGRPFPQAEQSRAQQNGTQGPERLQVWTAAEAQALHCSHSICTVSLTAGERQSLDFPAGLTVRDGNWLVPVGSWSLGVDWVCRQR